jgi:hypothetical protein
MRFALAPMISGTFVVSSNGRASLIEWAHIIAGYATIYLIIGLLLRSTMHRELRLPGSVALVLALLEAAPGMPRFHAALSPLLFSTLVWAALAQSANALPAPKRNRLVFILPALVLMAIVYGVGYRHQTSSIVAHIGAAMLAAGVIVGFCMVLNQNHPDDATLRGAANVAIAAVLFQVVAGSTAMVIRMLDMNGGLTLGLARTAHITGAGPVLAASALLAIQYRRSAV